MMRPRMYALSALGCGFLVRRKGMLLAMTSVGTMRLPETIGYGRARMDS